MYEKLQCIRYAFSCRVRVPARQGSAKIEMKGIFMGAKVIQGHDWEWGQQDGGKGNTHSSHPWYKVQNVTEIVFVFCVQGNPD